jgi:hypothetical protein
MVLIYRVLLYEQMYAFTTLLPLQDFHAMLHDSYKFYWFSSLFF